MWCVWIITPGSTGTLYWETWSCQLERGGSLEISSSQKLYDMIRLTGENRIISDWYSVIVTVLKAPSGATAYIFAAETENLWFDFFKNQLKCINDVLFFVLNQSHSVKPSKYCYSLNNPINPNAFQTSTTGWFCPCQAQFRGYSELNTHLCESEILQLQQMASIRSSC